MSSPPKSAQGPIQSHAVKIEHVEELGDVRAISTQVERELGFQGSIGGCILLSYGETTYKDEEGSDRIIGTTSNSIALATHNPTEVYDVLLNDAGYPLHFLEPTTEYQEDPGEYALRITNVVEISPGKG